MYIVVFLAALLTSATLTRLVRDYSIGHGWVSLPDSERHVHTHPIPRLGGVAIFLTLWGLTLLAHSLPGNFGMHAFLFSHLSLKIMGPATIVFLVGLVDDFCGLSAYTKFGAQALAALLLFANGLGISNLSILSGHPHWGWVVGLPLTILWVAWITNAFNLIDGLDGLAAGSALFTTLVSVFVALIYDNEVVLFLTLALAGAITGFLRYNFNPASIFLGDCGSLLIGFLVSGIAIAGSHKSPTIVAVVIPVISLGLPILDVTVAVLRRFLSCKRLFDSDREHIHHKLLSRGISHRQAVLVLYGVSACFGLLSLLLLNPRGIATATVLIVVGIGVLIGLRQLRYLEFLELARVANRTLNQRHVIANGISIRRAADVLKSCANLPQFCQILRECLEPIGFDGFGLYLTSKMPVEVDLRPFHRVSGSKLHFFWNPSLTRSRTNWSLTIKLTAPNGNPLGGFTLYRNSSATPIWLDFDVFTTAGFSGAIGAIVEKMQDSLFQQTIRKQRQKPAFNSPGEVLATGISRSIAVLGSG